MYGQSYVFAFTYENICRQEKKMTTDFVFTVQIYLAYLNASTIIISFLDNKDKFTLE